ncbi:hypothetical protein ATKI12_8168 [Kitasatospora sp. Ki12]|uniref:hypothetical protein n=1 Tax=Kitasatospora xanthocidica TaxID=83382 RepID=UPI00167AA695|nr:hypothetical protein [Kitasatospora xanthocidica]GHF83001.1 hypothetical protein GCM10018790_70940 [Kitasatospora xanthocidica]
MEHARLTVTLRPTTGTLARLASTLNNHRVLDLAFSTAAPAPARAVVRVPRPEAVRVQQKLRRMVDVLDVALEPAGPAEGSGPAEEAGAVREAGPVGGRGR